MNKRSFFHILFSGLVALLLLAGSSLPVAAGGKTVHPGRVATVKIKPGSVITLSKLAPSDLGKFFSVEGSLKDLRGRPIKGRSVLFSINGVYLGQAKTDDYGLFERKFNPDLNAGTYTIVAYWNGTHDFAPSSTATKLEILPNVVKVQTVPAVAGLAFTMAGQRFVTNDQGLATVKVSLAGDYRLTVLVDEYHSDAQRIKFGRWLEESYDPTTNITVPVSKVIQVGLNVFRPVGQSFLDLDGFPVDPNRISEFMIRSAQGDVFIFHDGQTRWIPSSRIARRITGLEETKLLYSVISVTIDGSNVVNQSQQRFYTYPTENWPISLLLYSLRISARDGLFGTPVGKSVNIEFPDGKVLNYPLEKDGTVVIRSLARGNYYMELVGTLGLKNRTPVALSRNQDVNTNVITYLDLALVSMLALLVALGLLYIGRPSLFKLLRRTLPQSQPAPQSSPEPRRGTGPLTPRGTGPLTPRPETFIAASPEKAVEVLDYSGLRYEHVRTFDDGEFKRSTGIERPQFDEMLSFLQKEVKYSGRSLSHADQLLLTIMYLREHTSMVEVAPSFGVSVETARRAYRRVKAALLKSGEFNRLTDGLLKPSLTLLPATVSPKNIEPFEVRPAEPAANTSVPANGDD